VNIVIESIGIHYPGGPRTVAINLFAKLFELDGDNQYRLLLTQPEPALRGVHGNVQQIILPYRNRFMARLIPQLRLPFLLGGTDLIHYTKNLGFFLPGLPSVLTIHDLTVLRHPEIYPKVDRWYYRTVEKWTARQASKIVTVSKNAAADIAQFYAIDPKNIRVIYHGLADWLTPASPGEIERVRQRYRLTGAYLLAVGRIDPKKNYAGLVRAFDRFIQRSGFMGQLVIAGEPYKKTPDLELVPTIQSLKLEDRVVLTGRVPDSDLAPLYSGATASVYATIHEGFGLVALEAMACGTPLITHQAGAVVEVVGDAAYLTQGNSPAEIAEAMEAVVLDPHLRAKLREKGLDHARYFRWERAAAELLDVYRCVR
jgi:glycosyltransferase involved in cell wall biosynthesis